MINFVKAQIGHMVFLALFGIAISGVEAVAQQYELGPGDRVSAQIAGLNAPTYVATIDTVGNIRLPYLGTFSAAGKTLDQLTEDITLDAAGRQIRATMDGAGTVFVLNESDVFLDIAAYRPVIVTGAVAAPGLIPFEPGLSARAAIGMAGGFALLSGDLNGELLATLTAQLEEFRQTEAWLQTDLWRIDAVLGQASEDTPPDARAASIQARVRDEDLDIVRERIALTSAQQVRERDDLFAQIALTESRVDYLTRALELYEIASASEERRLTDLLSLADRGLTTSNTIDSARSGALNASSRVLGTEADLAGAEQQLQSQRAALLEIDATFRVRMLEEKVRIGRSVAEIRARIDGLRERLSLVSLLAESEDDVPTLRILLYRRVDGEENIQEITPGTLLSPGDVVEVLRVMD
jgi:polysaccharide export outer membrane protein